MSLSKVWTIWRLTFSRSFPVDFFYELGLNLFPDGMLFAEPPTLVYQFLVWIGSIYAGLAPPADSGFDGVWAATVSTVEPIVAALQPAASFLRSVPPCAHDPPEERRPRDHRMCSWCGSIRLMKLIVRGVGAAAAARFGRAHGQWP
jgi:hypothetical protein